MPIKVVCTELTLPWFQVNALAFIPALKTDTSVKKEWALFTHGYTSHKGDVLNWATRLVEADVPCLIFDQPGHYLGSFHEVQSLQEFKDHVHELFREGFLRLDQLLLQNLGAGNYPPPENIILGGHSLGAFTAIKALKLPEFESLKRIAIGVGIGIGQRQAIHIFETAFYEKTLAVRRQLVSPVLDSKDVFAWLKESKEQMTLSGERIHLITGEDDVVVGPGGMEAFLKVLEDHGNNVTWEKPKRLPHHEPGAATPHMFAFLKNHFGWK
jgi:predicted esterase